MCIFIITIYIQCNKIIYVNFALQKIFPLNRIIIKMYEKRIEEMRKITQL